MLIAVHSTQSGAGKDEFGKMAEGWCDKHNVEYQRYAFADQMKVVAARALGLENPEDIERAVAYMNMVKFRSLAVPKPDEFDIHTIRGRDFIIGLAEGIRAIAPTFWIEHCFADPDGDAVYVDLDIVQPKNLLAVVTDCRFLPEADWIKQQGGLIVTIDRPGAEHNNEDTLPFGMADMVIENTGSLAQFQGAVWDTLNDLLGEYKRD